MKVSGKTRKQIDAFHQQSRDLKWVADHWARYVAATVEYSAAGWPPTTNNETGIVAKGGVPAGIQSQPDHIAEHSRRAMKDLARTTAAIAVIRRHVESNITPIDPAERYLKDVECYNPPCHDTIKVIESDIALPHDERPRCEPCKLYLLAEGREAPPRTVANRNRMRDERETTNGI